MPHPTSPFKDEIKAFLNGKYGPRRSVLDMGCGAGTYGRLLQRNFDVVDAVEIFEPYVAAYGLPALYRHVFVADVRTFEFDYYDIVLLADVLEHLSEDDGVRLIARLYDRCDELVVGLPFFCEQGQQSGNAHEAHLQPAITHERFMRRYPGFTPYCLRYDYGVYVKDSLSNRRLEPIVDSFPLEEATRLVRGDYTVTLVTAIADDVQVPALDALAGMAAKLIVFAPPALADRVRANERDTLVVSRAAAPADRGLPLLHEAAGVDPFTSTHLYWIEEPAAAARVGAAVADAPDAFLLAPSFFGGPKSVMRRAHDLYAAVLRAARERGVDEAPMTLLVRTSPGLFRTVVA